MSKKKAIISYDKMTIEQKDKKLFHIIHEAERDFPFQTSEFYSLEHD